MFCDNLSDITNNKMNASMIYHFMKNNILTDLILEISDSTNIITMNVHKLILATSCQYFQMMLTNSMLESRSDKISIKVTCAYITRDIILSFYGEVEKYNGYPEWKYQLLKIMCQNYFGLKFDERLIERIKIPDEGFELLIDIIEIIGWYDWVFPIILHNIPMNYDLTRLSKELLEKLIEIETGYLVSLDDRHNVKITNILTRKHNCINIFPTNNRTHGQLILIHKLNDEKIIITREKTIHIYDAVKKSLVDQMVCPFPIMSMSCHYQLENPDKILIVVGHTCHKVGFWNINGDTKFIHRKKYYQTI